MRTAFEFTCARAGRRQRLVLGLQLGGTARARRHAPRRRSPGADPARQHARLDVRRHRPGTRLRHPLARAALLLGAEHRTRSSVRASPSRSRCARPSRSAPTPTGLKSAARSRRPARASGTAACGAGARSRAARWPPATPRPRPDARAGADVQRLVGGDRRDVPHLRPAPRRRDLVRGPQHRRADRRARFRRRAAEHDARRPDQRLGRSARRPLLHLRAQGRRFGLVHGRQHRARAGGRSGDAGSQRDDGPRPRNLRKRRSRAARPRPAPRAGYGANHLQIESG